MTEGKNPANGNRIFDGVEVDAGGMVIAYYVHNTYGSTFWALNIQTARKGKRTTCS